MFGTLLRKELLTNLLTLRLAVVLVFAVALTALTVLVGSVDYSANWRQYTEAVRQNEALLEDSHVYSQLLGPLRYFVPPEPLSILCRGTTQASGLAAPITMDTIYPIPRPLGSAANDRMQTLANVDFVQAIALLLSFLAVVLGFDGICGERERGTLALLLSHPVPRGTVLAAKLAGGVLTLWIPLGIAFCLALLVVAANPDVHLTAADWGRAALLFGLSCLFLGQVYALALMVSGLTRRSGTALIACLFAWLVAGVGFANALVSISRYGVKEVPYPRFNDQRRDLWGRHDEVMRDWDRNHPPPGQIHAAGHRVGPVLRYARPEHYEWQARRNGFDLPRRFQVADELDRLLTPATTAPHIRQALLTEEWAVLSPIATYGAIARFVARTSVHDQVRAGEAGRRYRAAIRRHLEQGGLLADRRWFTDDPPGQEPMIADPAAVTAPMLAADAPFMQERLRWIEGQEEAARGDGRRQLDLADFPRFGLDWQRSVGQSLALATPGAVVLVLTFGLSVLVTAARLRRMDPRG